MDGLKYGAAAALVVIIPLALFLALRRGDLPPVALNSLSHPPAGLQGAMVFDTKEVARGTISAVKTDAAGRPFTINIALSNGPEVSLPAKSAVFDRKTHIVIADMRDMASPTESLAVAGQ